VAECLERDPNDDIDDGIAAWSDCQSRFTLIRDEYLVVELWQAERNAAELMEDAFRREVSFDSLTPPLEWSEAMSKPSYHLPRDQERPKARTSHSGQPSSPLLEPLPMV
jgi:hypothetical protein